jgi:hypothetical protein
MSDKINFVDENAVIEIKFNGSFYTDLKAMFMDVLTRDESKESIGTLLANLSTGKGESYKDFYLLVLYTIIKEIENTAKAEGYIISKTTDEITKENSLD